MVKGERGKHITIIAAVCSDGSYVPPTVVLCGKQKFTTEQLLTYGPDTTVTYTKNGWSNSDIFYAVLKSALKHVKQRYPGWENVHPKSRKPILILMDGHTSHTSTEILQYSLKNSIKLVKSPAHCTHIVQVLDSHQLFGAFQARLRRHVQEANAVGVTVDVSTFGTYFTQAWNDVFGDSRRIKRVFKEYGLYPYDPSKLDTSKLKQQSVIRKIHDQQKFIKQGMSPSQAMAVAQQDAASLVYKYDHQWERDILNHFQESTTDNGLDPATQARQSIVSSAIVRSRVATTPTPPVSRTTAEIICTRRKNKAYGQQAEDLTAIDRVEDAVEKEKQMKVVAVLEARKTEYNVEYKMKRDAVIKLNEENKEKRKQVKKVVTNARRSLKQAVQVVKQVQKRKKRRSSGVEVSKMLSCWCCRK